MSTSSVGDGVEREREREGEPARMAEQQRQWLLLPVVRTAPTGLPLQRSSSGHHHLEYNEGDDNGCARLAQCAFFLSPELTVFLLSQHSVVRFFLPLSVFPIRYRNYCSFSLSHHQIIHYHHHQYECRYGNLSS
jgi:hypothetical protein